MVMTRRMTGGEGRGGGDDSDGVLDIFCAIMFQVLHIMY